MVTDKEGNERGISMARSKVGMKKKKSSDGLSLPNQNLIIRIINKIW